MEGAGEGAVGGGGVTLEAGEGVVGVVAVGEGIGEYLGGGFGVGAWLEMQFRGRGFVLGAAAAEVVLVVEEGALVGFFNPLAGTLVGAVEEDGFGGGAAMELPGEEAESLGEEGFEGADGV